MFRKQLRRTVLAAAAIAAAATPAAHAATSSTIQPNLNPYAVTTTAPCPNATIVYKPGTPTHSPGGAAAWDDAVICLINKARSQAGVRAVSYYYGNQNLAGAEAAYQRSNRGTPLYKGKANLYTGWGAQLTPETAFAILQNKNANILGASLTTVGVDFVTGTPDNPGVATSMTFSVYFQ